MKLNNSQTNQTDHVFFELHRSHAEKTDRMFTFLFVFQWILAIVLSSWNSPTSWSGSVSSIHLNVYLAVFIGAALSAFPIWLISRQPGHSQNCIVVACAQMGYSVLLIHLTSGRIETHFHIFGSLAFLAFYRDYRPIVVATLITAADHFVRGMFWPEYVYGVSYSPPLRAIEHAAWVLFEDTVLFLSIRNSLDEMRALSKYAQDVILKSSKLTEIGKLAGNIVHEINNPVGIIQGKTELMIKRIKRGQQSVEALTPDLEKIISMTERLTKIIKGIKSATHQSNDVEKAIQIELKTLIEDSVGLFKERLDSKKIAMSIDRVPDLWLECRPIQIEQVLINLINNSVDAIEEMPNSWIKISFEIEKSDFKIFVTDSGPGIPDEVLKKLMQPFFTTKPVGKGTGLGLSISKEILEQHLGSLQYNRKCSNTCFVLTLPYLRSTAEAAQTQAS